MSTSRETEVEQFAEQVRALKERSHRSYGALARRVGVSASTLHRYGSGEAVPADFAPVERLARWCGASPQELRRLHQSWILADAVRRPRTPRASAPPAAPAPPEPTPPASGVTAPAAPVAVPLHSGPAPRPRRRIGLPPLRPLRRSVVLGAAGLVAVATGVASLGHQDPGTGAAGDRRPAAAPSPTSDGGTAPPPSTTPSARTGESGPRPPRTAPQPAGSASPGDPTPRQNPNPTKHSPGRPADARAPFDWTVNSHVWQSGCDHSYLIDRAPDRVPPPPAEQDAKPWARSLGALHGGNTTIRITLQGAGRKTVVLEALRVRVTERRTPAPRNLYLMSNGCGGALTPRHADVNLDAPRPVARSVAGFDGEAGKPLPAVPFPYTVTSSDPEVLLVHARTSACDCFFHLELEWSSGGRTGTVRIDDNGLPLRTSGAAGMPRYAYDTTERRWSVSED